MESRDNIPSSHLDPLLQHLAYVLTPNQQSIDTHQQWTDPHQQSISPLNDSVQIPK